MLPTPKSPRLAILLCTVLAAMGMAREAAAAPASAAPLIAELGCGACHAGFGDAAGIRARAPDLGRAGSRYRPSYLFSFLREPRRVRRHLGASRMPDFHLGEDEALALALFLAGERDETVRRDGPTGAGESVAGDAHPGIGDSAVGLDAPLPPGERIPSEAEFVALGRDLGCVTCHAFGKNGGVFGPDLVDAGARLDAAWMRRFVLAPHLYGVLEGTMPALAALLPPPVGASDGSPADSATAAPPAMRIARRIVDYLESSTATRRDELDRAFALARERHPDVDAAAGRRVFVALNCAACHRAGTIEPRDDDAPDLGSEGLRVKPDWLRAYLRTPAPIRPFGGRPGTGSRMPDFRLDAAEVETLAAFLLDQKARGDAVRPDFDPKPLTRFAERRTRALLETRLACLGCHRLGDRGGRVAPDLSNVADRLQPSFIDAIVRDPQSIVPHAMMPKLPMPERTRERLIRYLARHREPAPATTYLSVLKFPALDASPPGDAGRYLRYCAPCHGAAGHGDGFNAAFLPVAPTAHADAARLALRPDDTLFDGVSAGGAILGKSHLMPAWGGTLSRPDIAGLVRHIRELCRCSGPAWSRDPQDAAVRPDGMGIATRPDPAGAAARTDAASAASPVTRSDAPIAAPRPDPASRPDRTPEGSAEAPRHPAATATPVAVARSADPPRFEDFLGSRACAGCHAGIFDAWSRSTHAHAGGEPGDVTLIAPFDGKPIQLADAVVIPKRKADGKPAFTVRGASGAEQEFTVDAVVGGGHMLGGGTQAFFTRLPDGSVRFLPFDWIRDEGVWFAQRKKGPPVPLGPAVSLGELRDYPPRNALGFAPGLPETCEHCHGSQILTERDPKTGHYDTRWTSLSINCESCHGPGRRHVEWARAGKPADSDHGFLIPLDVLGPEASLEVCLRCHADKEALADGDLPGAELGKHFSLKLNMLSQAVYLPDGRFRGFGYQQNHLFSDCWINGSMVCTDCHDPHSQHYRDVTGRALEGRFDDGQCTGCHASKAESPERHTHHAAGSEASRCTSCHMPYLQHPFFGKELAYKRSDHTVSIPRPASDARLGIEGACVKCHPDRSVDSLEASWHAFWGPGKPRDPAIQALLDFRPGTSMDDAATLLLRPDSRHAMGQYNALATFVRNYVRSDRPALSPRAAERLTALAASDDVDVRALALVGVDLGAERAPALQPVRAAALADLGAPDDLVRLRWAQGLDDMAAIYTMVGGKRDAQVAREKAAAVRAAPARSLPQAPEPASPSTALPLPENR